MKVLFVLEHFHPFVGGVAILFEELAKELTKQGCQIEVVTTWLPGLARDEVWNGIAIHRVKTPPFSRRYWFTILAIPATWKRARKADIIQTTTYNAALPAWVVAKIAQKPIVITVHEVWGRRWLTYPGNKMLNWIYYLIEKMIVRLPYTQLLTDSQATAADLVSVRKNKLHIDVAYPGIDYHLFDSKLITKDKARSEVGLDDNFWFISYGRPGISKGIEYLVEAMVELKVLDPKARLLLILNEDPKDRYLIIKQLITRHKLEQSVRLIKPVSREKLPINIVAADCVIVPSLAEGFGFTAAEACAMGQPLITTTAGSLPEVAWGRVNFAKPGDTADLVKVMRLALAHKYGLVKTKHFTWQMTGQKYLNIYQQVLGAGSHENS